MARCLHRLAMSTILAIGFVHLSCVSLRAEEYPLTAIGGDGKARYDDCTSYLILAWCKTSKEVEIPSQLRIGDKFTIDVNNRPVTFKVHHLRGRDDGWCWAFNADHSDLEMDTLFIKPCRAQR
jgi:hypothetical protein